MINYSYETKAMTLAEKEILAAKLKSQKFGLAIFLIFFLLLIICGYLFITNSDESLFGQDSINSPSVLLAMLPLTIALSMIYNYLNNEIKKDIELGETFIAAAKLVEFLTDDDFNNLEFTYQGKHQTHKLTFYFSDKTMINLKSLRRPIIFKEISRNQLEKSLKKDTLYRLTFALNTEYLFSIEEL
jgi:hypothetical protein